MTERHSASASNIKITSDRNTFSGVKQTTDHLNNNNNRNYQSFQVRGASSSSSEESSLGILDMDGVSDFGSTSERNVVVDTPLSSRVNANNGYTNFVNRLGSTPMHDTEWESRRPKASINVSDIIDDRTIDGRTGMRTPMVTPRAKDSDRFEPNEITGRSTACGQQLKHIRDGSATSYHHSPTVEEILATSIATNIRDLCSSFRSVDVNNSDGEGLTNHHQRLSFRESRPQDSFTSEEFVPADRMRSRMEEDEKQWQDEFGVLPSSNSGAAATSAYGRNTTEMSGFSSCRYGDRDNRNDFSMGNFFSRRCEDVREMIPGRSPVKAVKPVALVDSDGSAMGSFVEGKYSQMSSSFYTDDELKLKSHPKVDNATYDKALLSSQQSSTRSSLCSLSTIERQLNMDQSPSTIVENLMKQRKQPKPAQTEIIKPVDENILYMTKPIPFDKPAQPGLVEVLQVEQFYGQLNWENFKKAPRVDVIDGNPKVLTSTQNLQSFEDTEHVRQRRQSDHNASNENKENVNKRLNYTDDTESLTGSNLDLTISSSIQFKSIAESDASPKRRSASRQFNNDWNALDARQPATTNLDEELNRKRARSPLPYRPVENVAQGLRPMASAPHLGATNLTNNDLSRNIFYRNNLSKNTVTSMGDSTNSHDSAQSFRQFQLPMSPRNGSKYSLPSYGLATQSPSKHIHQTNQVGMPVQRSSSQCSSNSDFHDGRLPLKANKGELIWDCTELRQSAARHFTIKNCGDKRLSLKVEVIGPGFQLTGLDVHVTLVLQSKECRTITVNFCPTIAGKARGKVIFSSPKYPDINRAVHLFGYGGKTLIRLQGLQQGPVGLPFLKLGDTNHLRSEMTQKFTIYNQGPLNGIAYIGVKPESAQHLRKSCINIVPDKCVIRANSEVVVRVTYNLRKKDFVKLMKKSSDVMQIGILEVFYGTEANRLRLQALLNKKESSADIARVCNFIVNDFPVATTETFDDFGESTAHIAEIFGFFRMKEFALTLNKHIIDETRESEADFQITGIEESLMFKTLQSDTSSDDLMVEQENDRPQPIPDGTWSVHPRVLRFDQRLNTSQQITIRNNFAKPQTFQLESNVRNLFSFSSDSGRIEAGQNYTIDVQLRSNGYAPSNVMLTVYIETDSIDIPVDIRSVPPY